ncbi:MAG: hypothetical protein A2X35_04170 [Elusimicrobia bacterium GWA2_61_42]|nr:MAG: hypothetical protein A2X35_04170 [Elusimicrobia bacterium GWA2_61_42]OGR74597.1 MAG: hypothetical protein A2X38_05375 [Elusimicrobia bacterium GWC2_61_25]
MKKVIAMLALVALTGNIASAELLKNFKYDGKIDVNAYNANNADFNKKVSDKISDVDTRVQLNMGFDLNEDVNAVVSIVKLNREYGDAKENANTIQAQLVFEQAYLNLKNVFGLDHKLGRQYYGNAGDMVVYYGPMAWPFPTKYAPTSPAVDGWTGWYKFNGLGRDWDLHAILAKEDATNTAASANDSDVSGINAKTTLMDISLNGYVYHKNDKKFVAGTSNYLDVLGIKAKYAIPQVKNLNVAAEYAQNMGKDLNKPAAGYKHQGFAYKVNADYSMDFMGKLGFEGEYYFASGDEKNNTGDTEFTSINGDYRPGIISGGGFLTDVNFTTKGSGQVVYNVGANWTPSKLEKLNVAAKYYNFSADKKAGLVKKYYGSETDVVATWTHSANVDVKGYYAMVMPEKDNTVSTKDNAQTMMGAAFCVKF